MAHMNGDSAPLLKNCAPITGISNLLKKSSKLPVNASTTKHSPRYNMKHKKRGMAVIFNHDNFKKSYLKERTGTAVDRDNLEKVLKKLGFQVKVYDNLTSETLKNTVQEIAVFDHSDADCVLIAVLTHGEFGCLHAYDNYYKPEILWNNFTADKCTTLAGKPKLFFVQGCEGDQVYKNNVLSNRTQTDGHTVDLYNIPSFADFLIAYSTVPGYLSWCNNPRRGSWFIQALTEELAANAKQKSLLSLLTNVNQKLASNLETYSPNYQVKSGQKQIPCFNSMLIRILIFDKK